MKIFNSAVLAVAAVVFSADIQKAQGFAFVPTSQQISRVHGSFGLSAANQHRLRPTTPTRTDPRRRRGTAIMGYTVGVVGATGAVGVEIVKSLGSRGFATDELRIFGSERSAGRDVPDGKGGIKTVEKFEVDKCRECDVVFLAVSGDFALEHAKAISEGEGGAVVIDNSSAFRYEKDIPLVVPEINGECTKNAKLVANPNCTTAIGLMALWPIHKLFGLKRVIMSTYQAASGAGQPGMDELQEGTRAVLSGERDVADNKIFAHPLPFNVIPHIDKFQENGYTKEVSDKILLAVPVSLFLDALCDFLVMSNPVINLRLVSIFDENTFVFSIAFFSPSPVIRTHLHHLSTDDSLTRFLKENLLSFLRT
mmetsp:Transcript_17758/g.40272  ORF Transcript_17758/g.40272 Transcript_17758/m.40272 type:complete len:366 (-) Transcript_17758:1459-2556(-)